MHPLLVSFFTRPLVRLPIALLFVAPGLFAPEVVRSFAPELGRALTGPVAALAATVLAWAAYVLYVRLVERRAVAELGWRGGPLELARGAVAGGALFSAAIGVLALAGAYRITGMNAPATMALPFVYALAAAVLEEIVFRGVIFRLIEASLGTWIALVVSAALFGLGHAANPHASALAVVAVGVEAGILLGAAFVLTRRLWLAIGIHAGWNFVQGGIFSVPTSGVPFRGLFESTLAGPAWLAGGAFGVEASAVAVLLCVAAGAAMLWWGARRGHVVAPFWARRNRPAAPAVRPAPVA